MADTLLKSILIIVITPIAVGAVSTLKQPGWWCSQSFVQCRDDSPPLDAKPTISGSASSEGAGSGSGVPPSSIPPVQPVQPIARMSALRFGTNLQGQDISGGQTTMDAEACSSLCQENDDCKAMTYVYLRAGETANGICWLKNGVPGSSANSNMVSAVKGSTPVATGATMARAPRMLLPWTFNFQPRRVNAGG